METLYLLKVDSKMQNPDLQSLELSSASPMNYSFKDAHKNTLRSQNSHKVDKDLTWIIKRVEAEHGETLKELEPLIRAHNPKNYGFGAAHLRSM